MSEWDFAWGLTGQALIDALASGFGPGEDPLDHCEDDDEYAEVYYTCSRCGRDYSEDFYLSSSCCPHCGQPFDF